MTTPVVRLGLRRSFYPVVGSTPRQLRTLVGILGLVRGGQRFGAFTDWEIAWRYRHAADSEGHRICEATIDVFATITSPRWSPPRTAGVGLVSAWKKYAGAIEIHEQGHVALAVEAGSLVRSRLLALPAHTSKAALDEAAQAAAEEVLCSAQKREISYDQITGHGASQGVIFPSDEGCSADEQLPHDVRC